MEFVRELNFLQEKRPLFKMLSLEEKVALLRTVEMFESAPDEIVEKIAELSTEKTFGENEDLIQVRKRCSNLYVSIRGEFSVLVPDGEVMREVARLGKGKVFGEIGAVSGLAATATVRSLTPDSQVLALAGAPFHAIVSQSPELAEAVLRFLARYLPGNK
ncbi:MAG: cyclic nucleotide-binding domain-containing protein [Verrucomicrobiales bacterium]|nr:cyclic nucleotide-binding domain-containing protein [Verrucomicrobiales bacterium]